MIDPAVDPALVLRDSSDGIDIYRNAQPRSTLPALSFALGQPRLLLLPQRNQLGASLVLQASGSALQPMPPGEVDVVFGLRYEGSDRTLRAVRPEILDLRLPGVAPESVQAVRALLPAQWNAARSATSPATS